MKLSREIKERNYKIKFNIIYISICIIAILKIKRSQMIRYIERKDCLQQIK